MNALPPIAFTAGNDGKTDVHMIDPDGSNARRLTFEGWGVAGPWSPVSNELVIQYQPLDLAILDLANSSERLVPTAYPEASPAGTLDGTALVFTAWSEGQVDRWRLERDGSRLMNLTRSPLGEEWFSIGRVR